MLPRIVEIADDHRHLGVFRGFMVVSRTDEPRGELGRVALDDIGAVICNAHGVTYTNSLLVELAERNAPFVICGRNHTVKGILFPVDGNFMQARRFDAQTRASMPTRKRLWADLVRAKLQTQLDVLRSINANPAALARMISRVRAGDPQNIEAQAARLYWPMVFGSDFRRDRHGDGVNVLLNYGYTVLRAATARAVAGAGLHPTIALHHANEGNALRLADDLMEPFRPYVDVRVHELWRQGSLALTADAKRCLVHVLYYDLPTTNGVTPMTHCLERLAISLAQVFLGERRSLELPMPGVGRLETGGQCTRAWPTNSQDTD